MSESSTIVTISNILEKAGYKAKINQEINSIESATGGVNFLLSLDGKAQILHFSLGMKNDIGFDYSDVNDFNKTYSFGKAYMDDAQDIILEFDMVIAGLDLERVFTQYMLLWDGLVSSLLREIQSKATSAGSATA